MTHFFEFYGLNKLDPSLRAAADASVPFGLSGRINGIRTQVGDLFKQTNNVDKKNRKPLEWVSRFLDLWLDYSEVLKEGFQEAERFFGAPVEMSIRFPYQLVFQKEDEVAAAKAWFSKNYPNLKESYSNSLDYLSDLDRIEGFETTWNRYTHALEYMNRAHAEMQEVLRTMIPVGPVFYLPNGHALRRPTEAAALEQWGHPQDGTDTLIELGAPISSPDEIRDNVPFDVPF